MVPKLAAVSTILLALTLALFTACRAHAHEVVADARVEPTEASAVGVVHKVVVEDDTRGSTRTYSLVTSADGVTMLVGGAVAARLEDGGRYALHGTLTGKVLAAQSATREPIVAPKAATTPVVAVYDGILRLGHADYTDRPSEYFYAVFMANGHHKQMRDLQLVDALQNGMDVSVSGTVVDGDFTADRVVIHQYPKMLEKSDIVAKSTATHTVFVAPVLFPSTATPTYPLEPFTVATLDSAVFGVAPIKSVAEYYKEVSYGQQLLTGVTAKSGSSWPHAAQMPPPDSKGNKQCDTDFIQQQGNAAATAAGYTTANTTPGFMTPGSTASENHVVFVFNSADFACGWSGLGYIGYGLAFSNQSPSLLVIGHELGHTFGLYHAGSLDCGAAPIGGSCSVTEYGDPFDVMGNISGMHFNAFQKNALAWIPASGVATHAGGSASYTLSPLESPGGAKYAIKVAAGPNRTYWIEYRQPIGFDSGIATANANGAQVRVARPTETVCSTCDSFSDDTELLDMSTATSTFSDAVLPNGSRFVDAFYGVAVDVTSQSPTSLGVKITSLARPAHPDFDGSATTDIIWRNASNGQTLLWLMNGIAATKQAVVMSDPNWSVVRAADLNGDWKSDIIWHNASTGQTALWLMNGTSASAASAVMNDPNWTVENVGDFNGDGNADLIWHNAATGVTAVWLMNGVSAIGATVLMTDPHWTIVAVADFNGDGKSDLVWHNSSTGQTAIWLMNGMGAIAASGVMSDPHWTVAATGDFNGDGKADLLWQNSSTGQSAIWLMNGLSATAAATVAPDATWTLAGLGDFDGDGRTDILWHRTNGDTLGWLMNGVGAKATTTLMSGSDWSVARVGDFNGDGRSDIVWSNASTGQSVIWLMNGLAPATTGTAMTSTTWSVQASY
ncbi:MAG TPA: FG-GAP-like repeat-containing protein [Casimicrobiaceae bacterium]